MRTRKTLGLALGAGSSKGWAHIGVLEALEEEQIPVDYIAGCSVGAFVGAIYATGRLKSLKDFVLRMDGKRVFSYLDVILPRSGLLDGGKVHELFSMHTDAQTFDDLRIPLQVVATDLTSGEKVVINSGDILEALRASMSIPGIFPPLEQKGRWLVDGGLVDPVPVGVARAMGADVVVAVDLAAESRRRLRRREAEPPSADEEQRGNEFLARLAERYDNLGTNVRRRLGHWFENRSTAPRILEVVESSVLIMQERIKRVNLAVEPPDVLVQPRLGDLRMFDYDQVARAISEGAERVREKMGEIKELLKSTS